MRFSYDRLRPIFKTMTGDPCCMDSQLETITALLGELQSNGRLNLPFDVDDVFHIEERFPIFVDIRSKRSVIVSNLFDRRGQVALVMDSVLSGKAALYFVTLGNHNNYNSMVYSFMERTNWPFLDMRISAADDEHVLILVSALSFVKSESLE